jgi:hypothetical protein
MPQRRQTWFVLPTVAVSAIALAASVSFVTPAARAAANDEKPAAHARAAEGHHEGGENPLHEEMEAMGKAFKKIRSQVSDPTKNESTLQLVNELERHTLAAKSMTPRGAATRPTDERAKYLADFRVDLANVLRGELELEEALVDNKNDKAAESVQSIADMMSQGHKAFRPKHKHG